MFKFLKRNKANEAKDSPQTVEQEKTSVSVEETASEENSAPPASKGLFSRLKDGLQKTRKQLTTGIGNIVKGKKKIDAELFQEIEEQLLIADIGVKTSQKVIAQLTQEVSRKQLNDSEALFSTLQKVMLDILKPYEKPLILKEEVTPFLILMVGVNGVGKTTTIGKLAKQFQTQGKSVMLAAGDTFRAAAVDQLQVWGERNNIPVIAQQTGADSASVIYDAFQAAKARSIDVLIADTAGRLHTQTNLMEELKKIKRVLTKIDANAPHEIMLVLDAGNGQNALNQARLFNEAVGVTGLALTKLDGTAKGGIIFGIVNELNIPVRYIGIGEQIDDLRSFAAQEFVAALFSEEEIEE